MKKQPFNIQLNRIIAQKSSFLCVGLDPVLDRIPTHLRYKRNPISLFIQEIIEATRDLAVAYKANLAFYEAEGQSGLEALHTLKSSLPKNTLLILDGKRGDIPYTSQQYARAVFEQIGAAAVTVHPYMGGDSIAPFLEKPEKGAFVLTLTTNKGSEDIQHLQVGTEPLYVHVAKLVNKWNEYENCGMVVSAADIEGLQILRRIVPDLPFLVPGVGAQGGDLKEVVRFGRDTKGTGLLINIGRDIVYAGKGKDFAAKAAEKARAYTEEMARLMHTTWNF